MNGARKTTQAQRLVEGTNQVIHGGTGNKGLEFDAERTMDWVMVVK